MKPRSEWSGLLIAKDSMKSLFISKTVNVELSSNVQNIIACHLSCCECPELGNQLNNLAHSVNGNDIPQGCTIGSEAAMDEKHVDLGGGGNNTNVVDYHKMSIREIEEFDIKKGGVGGSSDWLQDCSDLGYKITFKKGVSQDSERDECHTFFNNI